MLCLLLLPLASCQSWLDVQPIDRVSGEQLFETREGFVKALNGVYTEMASRSLYGGEMTMGFLDMVAQYYNWRGTNTNYDSQRRFQWEDYNPDGGTYTKAIIDAAWSKTYNLIVNLNIIIEQADTREGVLNDTWLGIIKGEALALRAMLHLDMLRMFGPVPSKNVATPCLPYVTNSDQTVTPLSTQAQFGTALLDDLTAAIALLEEADPIIEDGVMNSDAADNQLRYRQYRMNYFAARALLARAQLWFGNASAAYTTATELIADATETFPFVAQANATTGTNPDRIFSTEVMFAMSDVSRTTGIYDRYFSPLKFGSTTESELVMLPVSGALFTGRVSQLYITENDLRYKAWFGSYNPATSSSPVYYITKYGDVTTNNNRFMIPLIRLSELYLIAAETATDLDEGKSWLSQLRAARGAYDLTSADRAALVDNIEWEYRREFLGEGQIFFYYKRVNRSAIPDCKSAATTAVLQMGDAQYVITMPESETTERPELNQ